MRCTYKDTNNFEYVKSSTIALCYLASKIRQETWFLYNISQTPDMP